MENTREIELKKITRITNRIILPVVLILILILSVITKESIYGAILVFIFGILKLIIGIKYKSTKNIVYGISVAIAIILNRLPIW